MAEDPAPGAHAPDWLPVYAALSRELIWLYAKWGEYRKLYAHSPERIELLNGTGAFFFGVVEDVLWDDVILGLARITDKPVTAGKPNLTIQRLALMLPESEIAIQVKELVDVAVAKAASIKPWRDKRLAHNDLGLALEVSSELLPGISRQYIEDALEAVAAVLNHIQRHYYDTETAYNAFHAPTGAETLMGYLEMAVRADAQRRERLQRGCPLPEDFDLAL